MYAYPPPNRSKLLTAVAYIAMAAFTLFIGSQIWRAAEAIAAHHS